MDVAKAFTFVTEDENWITKIGIGALLTLVSILIFSRFFVVRIYDWGHA